LGGPELVRLFEDTENCEEGDESSGLRKRVISCVPG